MPYSVKLIGIGFLFSIFGLFFVQRDLRLLFGGRTVEAEVMDDYTASSDSLSMRRNMVGGIRQRDPKLGIQYRFKDDKGEMVIGGGKLPLDYVGTTPSNGTVPDAPKFLTVKVVYLPGRSDLNKLVDEPSSRQYWMLYFGLALMAAGFVVAKLESYFAIRHRIKKKSAPPAGMPVEPAAPQKKEAPKVLEFD